MIRLSVSAIAYCILIPFTHILNFSLLGQPVQNFTDYYDNEQKQKRREGKFVNGFEEGEWKFWYKGGNLKEISNYRNGKLHGKVTVFYENGSLQNEGFFKRNLPDSLFYEWYSCKSCKPGEKGALKVSGNFNEKVKTGLWEYFYPDGKKFKEEFFINGHPKLVNSWDTGGNPLVINGHGNQVEYFDDLLSKREECGYADSLPSGKNIIWYRNGKKNEEGNLVLGKRTGPWNFWYSSGKLQKKANYSEGLLEGDFTQYFSNGKTEMNGFFSMGKKTGKWIFFRESGSRDFEGEFKEDLEHGNWIYYYSSGEKESFGRFSMGKRDSLWVFLYKTGEKWKEGFFKEDLKNGKWTTWFETGIKLQEGSYLVGKEDGFWASWYEDGKKKDEGHFKNGLMEGDWRGWYPNGNKNYEGKIMGGLKEGEWTFWFVDGKLREKGKYSKGKKNGYWEFYHETGGRESEGTLIDEKHDGKWVYYYSCPECKTGENGQKMREENMNKGSLDGKATVWYPGGNIQSITHFKNGKPDGQWKQYNKNGILTMDRVYKNGTMVKDLKEEKK